MLEWNTFCDRVCINKAYNVHIVKIANRVKLDKSCCRACPV